MKVYVVSVFIHHKVVDVAVFDSYAKAKFFSEKWDSDQAIIQISETSLNQFRGSQEIA